MAVEQAGEVAPNGANSAQTVIYISLGYGMSLLVTAWSLYRVSGGLFNPAFVALLNMTTDKKLTIPQRHPRPMRIWQSPLDERSVSHIPLTPQHPPN